MKKKRKIIDLKTFTAFLIGGLLFSAIGASATTLLGSDTVSYTSTQTDATNIKEALDELYTLGNVCEEYMAGSIIYYLGTGTSFNIKSLLPNEDYTKLTSSSFVIEPVNGTLKRSGTSYIGDDDIYSGGSLTTNKSYNASTGVLTGSVNVYSELGYYHSSSQYRGIRVTSSQDMQVKAYYIKKAPYLGTGTSFDVKQLAPNVDYTKLTADNFIVEPVTRAKGYSGTSYTEGDDYYTQTNFSLSKSYNASTGVFTASANATTSGGYYHASSVYYNVSVNSSFNGSVNVYLIVDPLRNP